MRSEIRELRQSIALSQEEFARLLDVPLETLRTWDSASRTPPSDVQVRARQAIADHQRQHELLSLDALATEFGIHQRTLRDAVRAGRLAVQLSTRSAFGRPIRRATRAAVLAYRQQYYRRSYSRTMRKPPIPTPIDLPEDYAERVILTRHALRMTLSEFAERIGAANKAVVYQWESGKRKPSSVFWARIVALRSPRR
jgi:DNA-binding transcriptional regulator YiaG